MKDLSLGFGGFGSLPASGSGYADAIILFFAHLLILEYPDHHHNLISSSLYYPGLPHKISSQSVHKFLSNVHKQTNKQTNQRYQKHNLLCQGGIDCYTHRHNQINEQDLLCHLK